jgi:hypothetical protein
MIRRASALAALTIVAAVASACGPSAPALTDPTEIVTAALTSTEAAKSVHMDVAVDGTATIALPGAGTSGAPIKLDGTTAAVDLDLANGAAKATFTAPALFNVTGEVIVVDGKAYLKTTLQGPQYQVVDLGQALAVDPTDTSSMVDALGDFMLKPGVDPVKGDDVACGSAQCYTVTADLTAEELAALGGTAAPTGLPVDLAGASLAVTVRVEKDLPHHLAGLNVAVTAGDGNVLTLDAIMSRWDEPVTITAPPADQVKNG